MQDAIVWHEICGIEEKHNGYISTITIRKALRKKAVKVSLQLMRGVRLICILPSECSSQSSEFVFSLGKKTSEEKFARVWSCCRAMEGYSCFKAE